MPWGKIPRTREVTLAAIRRCTATLSVMLILMVSGLAQDQAAEIRAVTIVAPPFVMKQGDQLTGFSIDLWNEIAARLKLKTNYQVAPNVSALMDTIQTRNADIIVAPVFYWTERDAEYDFSHPVLEAGLQVLVRGAVNYELLSS